MKKIYEMMIGAMSLPLAYFSNMETSVKVLLLFMVLDFSIGFVRAYVDKTLSSKKMSKGGLKKGMIFLVLIVSYWLGVVSGQDWIIDVVTVYYITMEALSIFEHAIELDLPLPSFLVKLAESMKVNADSGESIN